MTTNVNSLNSTGEVALAVSAKVSARGMNFFQRLVNLFAPRLSIKSQVDDNRLDVPISDKTPVTFHRPVW